MSLDINALKEKFQTFLEDSTCVYTYIDGLHLQKTAPLKRLNTILVHTVNWTCENTEMTGEL